MKDFQTLSQKHYARKVSASHHIDDKTIFHVFSKVILDEYGQCGVENIIPEYYTKNTIFVIFKKSIWAQEVWLNRQKIINKVNENLGKKILYNIKVKS